MKPIIEDDTSKNLPKSWHRILPIGHLPRKDVTIRAYHIIEAK